MNLFVADSEWGWWIIWYFFLGGIAAGSYFVAGLIDWVGREEDRRLSRLGYRIAFPLICVCGLFLTVDLYQPERFWHMMFRSEIVHQALDQGWPRTWQSWSTMSGALLFKYWSPMSIGAWALLIFGAESLLSFLGTFSRDAHSAPRQRGLIGRCFRILGPVAGFFIAAYTGVLLNATNEPLWSDSAWIAPLFLTSATSAGIATMLLLFRPDSPSSSAALERLERANFWALSLEAIVFVIFLVSLGGLLRPVLATMHGKVLVGGTLLLGILLPIAIHWRAGLAGRSGTLTAALLTLLGGFVLRYTMLTTPPELLARAADLRKAYAASFEGSDAGDSRIPFFPAFSPEDGRPPGGGPGADPGNRAPDSFPRSKVYHGP